jgi:hypothetical protein
MRSLSRSTISVATGQFATPTAPPSPGPPTLTTDPPQQLRASDVTAYVIEIFADGGGARTIPATTLEPLQALYFDGTDWGLLNTLATSDIDFTDSIAFLVSAFPGVQGLGLVSPLMSGDCTATVRPVVS